MWGGRGACACGGGGGWGGGGVILGEVKARPKDIISFSLDYISKSKVQTSNPSSSPISLDTPARPADYPSFSVLSFRVIFHFHYGRKGMSLEVENFQRWEQKTSQVSEAFKIAAPGGIVGSPRRERKWETP